MSRDKGFNFGMAYNRPQEFIAPYEAQSQPGIEGVAYTDYGYIPGVAQYTQQTIVPPPSLNPQPAFSVADVLNANWFTTRVHLSPLGKVGT
jgi:hypothetical protein